MNFLNYVRPLIGEDWPSVPMINGRQRFARFEMKFADKKLPVYKLEAYENSSNSDIRSFELFDPITNVTVTVY